MEPPMVTVTVSGETPHEVADAIFDVASALATFPIAHSIKPFDSPDKVAKTMRKYGRYGLSVDPTRDSDGASAS